MFSNEPMLPFKVLKSLTLDICKFIELVPHKDNFIFFIRIFSNCIAFSLIYRNVAIKYKYSAIVAFFIYI